MRRRSLFLPPPLSRSLAILSLLLAPQSAFALPLPLPDDALVEQGSVKLEANDYEGALLLFRDAEKRAPKDPRPHFLRGATLAKLRKLDAAITAYREALALDGSLAAVHNELGALLQETGKLDEAIAEYRKAAAADPKLGEPVYNLGKLQSKKGDVDAAIASLKSAAQLLPRDVDVRIDLSVAYRKANKLDDAVRSGREGVAIDAASEAAHLNLGFALQAAKKLDDAVSEFKVAIRLDPKSATAWWAIGTLERDRQRLDPAVVALQHAWEEKPTPSILRDLAMAILDKGDAARAEKLVRSAVEKSPRSLGMHLVLAKVLAREKRCADANRELAPLPQDKKEVLEAEAHIAADCPSPPTKK